MTVGNLFFSPTVISKKLFRQYAYIHLSMFGESDGRKFIFFSPIVILENYICSLVILTVGNRVFSRKCNYKKIATQYAYVCTVHMFSHSNSRKFTFLVLLYFQQTIETICLRMIRMHV